MNGAIGSLSKSKMSRVHRRLGIQNNPSRRQGWHSGGGTCLFLPQHHHVMPMINVSLTEPGSWRILQKTAVVVRHCRLRDPAPWTRHQNPLCRSSLSIELYSCQPGTDQGTPWGGRGPWTSEHLWSTLSDDYKTHPHPLSNWHHLK